MDTIFSKKEQNIRKWWLRIFLFSCAYSCFMFISTPMNHVLSGYIGFSIALFMRFPIYHYGYRKMGTRWLTASIWLSWAGLLFLIAMCLGSVIGSNGMKMCANQFWLSTVEIGVIPSIISHLTGLATLLTNIQLRKINKTRKPSKITIVSA